MSPAITGHTKSVDTVIVGNGPSALILSYILHGNIPRYIGRHPDDNLHHALVAQKNLLDFDSTLYDHLRSSLKYSSQAHAINVLLDTLLRPYGDVSNFSSSCVDWQNHPDEAVNHLVLGESPDAGGQWADNPIIASKDIGTLSYAEQLSLPGYTFEDHWFRTRGEKLPELVRPSRAEVAKYYAEYPTAVGIADSVKTYESLDGIWRTEHGFHIASHGVDCKHLVLATGTFSINLPPPRSLRPLVQAHDSRGPILVVGSGFTAADIIISASPHREIIHVYNWDPDSRPSPLKGCHSQAYPEYAWIYRQMKLAAASHSKPVKAKPSKDTHGKPKNMSTLPFFSQRDWKKTYTGFPNGKAAAIEDFVGSRHSEITVRRSVRASITGPALRFPIVRDIGTLHYAAGRRGSLRYLSADLLDEIRAESMTTNLGNGDPTFLSAQTRFRSLSPVRHDPDPWTGETDTRPPSPTSALHSRHPSGIASAPTTRPQSPQMSAAHPATISGQAFRDKIDETDSMEVVPDIFVIGSLTGDSLVRFAPGGCCVVAGAIMSSQGRQINGTAHVKVSFTNGDVKVGGKENKAHQEPLVPVSKPGRAAATEHVSIDGVLGDFHTQEQRV